MAFLDFRLPTRVEVGFSAIPQHLTRIKTLANGHEKRNAQWAQAKRRYTSAYASFGREQREELLNAVEVTEGQTYAFRFKDWNDFKADQQALGVSPAGRAPVQLVRSYTAGPRTKTRVITKPVASSVRVFQNGVAKPGTANGLTGLFTPATAWTPGAILTADFRFDVPVRFATDEIEFVLPHLEICQVRAELVEVFGE